MGRKSKQLTDFKPPETMTLPTAKKIMPVDIADLGLNPGEYRFVASYCTNGFVAWKAYYSAGYKAKTQNMLKSRSNEMLGRERVASAIRRFIDAVISPYKEKLEYMILEVYYRRAFYRVSMFYDVDGTLRELDEIEKEFPDWMVCIDGIREKSRSTPGVPRITEYILADRNEALRRLSDIVSRVKAQEGSLDRLPSEQRKRLNKIFDKKIKKDMIVEFPQTSKGGGS